jgi:hypothetical protein
MTEVQKIYLGLLILDSQGADNTTIYTALESIIVKIPDNGLYGERWENRLIELGWEYREKTGDWVFTLENE